MLLGSGTKGKDVIKLSKEIVKIFENDFDSLNLESLLQIHGLGLAKASQILCAIELSKRYLIKQNKKITSAADVYEELKEYHKKQQECFFGLMKNLGVTTPYCNIFNYYTYLNNSLYS